MQTPEISLSPEQQFALDRIKLGENVFVTGQAGTGKTLLIKEIMRFAKSKGKTYHVCALTGCAALLLGEGATTLHSFMGVGLASGDSRRVISTALTKKRRMAKLRATQLLVIDEVSMMSRKLFEIVQAVARGARGFAGAGRVFGGMQVVFTGDFMQLPPIGSSGDPDAGAFCFQCPMWNETFAPENQIELTAVFRQEDPVYRQVLTETRAGVLSAESVRVLESRLRVPFDPEQHNGCVPTKIFSTRASVDHVNRVEYGKLSGPEHVFGVLRSADFTMYVDTGMPIPKDKMRACAMLSPEETDLELTKVLDTSNFVNILRLKVGAVVMCTANVDLEAGICNGSQGVVVSAEGDAPIVRFHNGVQRAMVLHRIQSAEYPALVVSQVPLVLAWAISIHKCQGATMDIAEIDVGSTVFEFGQTYVALSRVKTLGGLYLSSLDVSRIRTNPVVRDFYARLAIASEARAAARAEEPAPEPKLDKGLCPLAEPELESESDVRAVSFSAFQFGGGGGACAVKKLE